MTCQFTPTSHDSGEIFGTLVSVLVLIKLTLSEKIIIHFTPEISRNLSQDKRKKPWTFIKNFQQNANKSFTQLQQ